MLALCAGVQIFPFYKIGEEFQMSVRLETVLIE